MKKLVKTKYLSKMAYLSSLNKGDIFYLADTYNKCDCLWAVSQKTNIQFCSIQVLLTGKHCQGKLHSFKSYLMEKNKVVLI